MDTNTMLREAITTDSRKRKARHQEELEAIGYKIVKDGCWMIINSKTNRRIRLDYNSECLHTSKNAIRFGCIWSYKKGCYVTKPLEKINLERLLNKNKIENNYDNSSNVSRMSSALYYRKYHKKIIDKAWDEFQSTLNELTKEYNRKIENAKKYYEWSMEHHTKSFENANKEIQELLKRN